MQFFTDEYFHIGRAHLGNGQPCQDYALSGQTKKTAWAIISDGCSSGGKTDIGARLITLTTAKALTTAKTLKNIAKTADDQNEFSVAEVEKERQKALAKLQMELEIFPRDMLTTCLYIFVTPQGAKMHIAGDGVIAVKYHNGEIVLRNFEWAKNMPYYPIYKNGLLEQFIQAHGNDQDKKCLQEQRWFIDQAGDFCPCFEKNYSIRTSVQGLTITFSPEELEKIAFLAVFSDGVTQVEGIATPEVVKRLLAFKNQAGVFAKRRMIRFIKNAQKIGRGPIDDISMAVIGLEKKEAIE